MGPIQSIADAISLLRRRIVPFTLVLSLGLLAALAFALSQPSAYEASSLIQIRNTGLNNDDALSAARRVQVIEQRLTRRESVMAMIEKHGLFANQPAMTDDERLFAFRAQNRIQMIDATGATPGAGAGTQISALLITSQAGNPQQAAQVANDLAASLMTQDAQERTRTTENLVAFLSAEVRRLTDELAGVDRQIGEIKNANEESLPEAAEALRTELAQLRDLQLNLDRQVLTLERDQLAAELRIESEETGNVEASLAARLSRLNSELAQARRVLPSTHPEVQRIEGEIKALRNNTAASDQSIKNREVELIESQRRTIEEQKQVIASRQQEIVRALERRPLVEQEIAGLARGQGQLTQQLSDVALQLAREKAQQSIQDTAASGGMVVLEEAQPPAYPISSKRKRLLAMGGMFSLGAAFLLIFLLELRRPVIRSARAMEALLGVVPIAAVPLLPSARRRTQEVARFALALAIFLCAVTAGGYLYLNRNQVGTETAMLAQS